MYENVLWVDVKSAGCPGPINIWSVVCFLVNKPAEGGWNSIFIPGHSVSWVFIFHPFSSWSLLISRSSAPHEQLLEVTSFWCTQKLN